MTTTRHRPPGRGRRAFTLFEVLIAVSLVVGLMGSVLLFYRYATETRARVIEQVEGVTAQRMVMDRLTAELRSVFNARSAQGTFSGSWDGITFSIAGPLPRSIWRKPADENQVPPVGVSDVQTVGYHILAYEDENGETVVDGLERTANSSLASASSSSASSTGADGEAPVEITGPIFASRIKFVRFRYYDGSKWQESWSGGSLPTAVEVSLGLDPLREGEDPAEYPYDVARRVIAVPGAASSAGNTVAPTLGGGGGLP